MTEPNMEWEECSNKDGLCIPEDGLHFVECELYRMKKPESSLRKKWDEGIRPCSFDEVENFMSMAISEAYEKGKAEERERIAEEVRAKKKHWHIQFERTNDPVENAKRIEYNDEISEYINGVLDDVLSLIHDNK